MAKRVQRKAAGRKRAAGQAPAAGARAAATRKALMIVGGPYHLTDKAGEIAQQVLAASGGGWELSVTSDLDALAALPTSDFAVLIIHTTGHREALMPEREKGLLSFVQGGGGLVAVHSAADSFRDSRAYIEMLNAEFRTHPRFQEIPVQITDRDHYLTVRMPDFAIEDELYLLQSHEPARSRILAETTWQGRRMPLVFVHPYGKGRVAYLALGHSLASWQNPEFQKLLGRSVRWATGAELDTTAKVRCGLLGYGPSWNMGKAHGQFINEQAGMTTVAVCDIDPARRAAAEQELPGLRTFESLGAMLKADDINLVVDILPHNLHAETALECLKAGRHVVLEKPFCLTTQEATEMIQAARRGGRMLSVFHNRRWDSDYQAIRSIMARGLLGKVFHVEAFMGGYDRPGTSWRSDKMVSGGALYDWGAHFVDWILRLMGRRVTQVTGFMQKRWWQHVTNEDQAEAVIRFEDGEVADLQISSLAAATKPRWRILGTQGALVSQGGDSHRVISHACGHAVDGQVPFKGALSGRPYYRNIADHLLAGEPLEVTAEQAREVIAVIETAERSSAEGRSLPLPPEVYAG